jgi:MFS family permease
VQARLNESWEGRRLIRIGLVIILAGMAGMVLVVQANAPIAVAVAAWTVAGLGMGPAYAPLSLMMLQEAPPGHEGQASASLNLTDVLGTAIGIGVGGAAVAAEPGRNLHLGVLAAFAAAAIVAVVAVVVTRRLPGTVGIDPAGASGLDAGGADTGDDGAVGDGAGRDGAGTGGVEPGLSAGTTARSEK